MLILGHRGAVNSSSPYQNSIAAFKEALKHCSGIETDAIASKDGNIYFVHAEAGESLEHHLDAKSIKIANGRHIGQMESSVIETLRLKNGSKIPNIEEVMALFEEDRSKILNIELKGKDVEVELCEKLQSYLDKNIIKAQQLIISSFNHVALLDVKEMFPEIKLGLLYTGENGNSGRLYPWSTHRKERYIPISKEHLEASYISHIDPNYIIVPHTTINQNLLDYVKQTIPTAKLVVWESTVEPENFNKKEVFNLIKNSKIVAALIVNNPKEFKL